MRPILWTALAFASGAAVACVARRAEGPRALAATPLPSSAVAPATDTFAQSVQPVLARRCTPCHAPGGKMYDRLPFDQPKVVADNRARIVRRIKVVEERQALEAWLATQP